MADPDELLDVYDAAGAWRGVKGRAAVHRDGDWHRCFHLWVLSGDAVLLQRRAVHKASWPGKLDATAAGHVGAGEAVDAGGAREVLEELGVAYPPGALVPVGVVAIEDTSGGLVNREFQHVHVVEDPRPLEAWEAWDRHELDGLVRMALGDFAALVGGAGSRPADAWDGERVSRVVVAAGEVLPARYLPGLPAVLRGVARGERDLQL
ncbi:MAG: hypothetical protein JWO90_1324 [Solirubrobacterales bacterium]|nr:hypothetical protein [Solirubrobacterales bacterium]